MHERHVKLKEKTVFSITKRKKNCWFLVVDQIHNNCTPGFLTVNLLLT